ncbi:MAG TPA: hypothetical protein VNE39_13150 [Planctomycetota bacterium]|nr:hypothetical protein [Planctomycetota bacterium]
MRTLRIVGLVGVACAVACGCGIGPRAIRRERASYNIALQQTAGEQMLLNLVRLKYREPTLFLEVGNISAQFEYLTETEGIGTFVRGGGSAYTGRVMPSYSERPTITYTPLQGEAYANRVITEIGLGRLAPLYATGWRVDRLIRMLVERAGDIRNDPTLVPAPGETLRPHQKLLEVARIWRKLQKNGDLAFTTPTSEMVVAAGIRPEQVTPQCHIVADKDGYRFCLATDGTWELRRSVPSGLIIRAAYSEEKDANTVDGYLKIKPGRTRDQGGRFVERIRLIAFSDVRDGGEKQEIAEVPVQIRSLNGILFYLGQGVEVPPAHAERGLVKVYADEQGQDVDCHAETSDLLNIRCSPTRPADAYVAVRYRGHWFYLNDADTDSKDTFSLLLILFALQSGDVKSAQPLLTIPIGGR